MNWTCPYCSRAQVLTSNIAREWNHELKQDSTSGKLCQQTVSITCANAKCRKLSFTVVLYPWNDDWIGGKPKPSGPQLHYWQLLPPSSAKPQPDYIPKALRDDYQEACLIRELSPKASATLSRRCLQGMIRDYCGISKGTLADEIKTLKKAIDDGKAPNGVQADTVDAIDAVRSIGNIGAHMEKDINVIVDIDPGEALSLIGLIEMLFDEWYVARNTRTQKIAALKQLAGDKQAQRNDATPKKT